MPSLDWLYAMENDDALIAERTKPKDQPKPKGKDEPLLLLGEPYEDIKARVTPQAWEEQRVKLPENLDYAAQDLQDIAAIQEGMDRGLTYGDALKDAERARTQRLTASGRYSQTGEGALQEGIARYAGITAARLIGQTFGEDSPTTAMARAALVPSRLPDERNRPKAGMEGERLEAQERRVGEHLSGELEAAKKPGLIDAMFSIQPEGPAPKAGAVSEGGPGAGAATGTTALPETERKQQQESFDEAVRKIDRTYYDVFQATQKAVQSGSMTKEQQQERMATAKEERAKAREMLSKTGGQPSAVREAVSYMMDRALPLKPVIEAIKGERPAIDAFPPVAAAKGLIELGKETKKEGEQVYGEVKESLKDRKDEPLMLIPGPRGTSVPVSSTLKDVPAIGLKHLGQAMTAKEKPLVGEERGLQVETPVAQALKVVGTVAPGIVSTSVGRAAAMAGISKRWLVPEQAMEPYQAGEPTSKTLARAAVFAGMMSPPVVLANMTVLDDAKLDYANTVASGLGFYDEFQAVGRALPIDQSGYMAKTLSSVGLGLDVFGQWEELAIGATGGMARAAERGYRAASTAKQMGATTKEATMAGLSAATPAAERVAKAQGYQTPDAQAVIAATQMKGAARMARTSGTPILAPEVRIRVDQTLKSMGVDPVEAERAWAAKVGGPDRTPGPERARVEAEIDAVHGKTKGKERDVEKLKALLEGASYRAAETNPAKYPTPDDWYKEFGVEYGDAWDPAKAAPGTLFQGGPSPQTSSPAFKSWFGGSKVVDAEGKPQVVYHGTDADFEAFADAPESWGQFYAKGHHFADNPKVASSYAMRGRSVKAAQREMQEFGESVGKVYPTYVKIENPYVWPDEKVTLHGATNLFSPQRLPEDIRDSVLKRVGITSEGDTASIWPDAFGTDRANEVRRRMAQAVQDELKARGYDGVIVDHVRAPKRTGNMDTLPHREYIAFSPEQVKSVFNRGTFDPNDPRVLFQGDPVRTKEEARAWHEAWRNAVTDEYKRTIQAAPPRREPAIRGPYQKQSKRLKGFAEREPKPYEEQKYKREQWVLVQTPPSPLSPNGHAFIDRIKGLNEKHALERAFENWDEEGLRITALDPDEITGVTKWLDKEYPLQPGDYFEKERYWNIQDSPGGRAYLDNAKREANYRFEQTGPGGVPRGATYRSAATGKLVAEVFKTGDLGTLLHENGHVIHLMFPDNPKAHQTILDEYGVNGVFTRDSYERFADDIAKYLETYQPPKVKNPSLVRDVFEAIRDILVRAWNNIRGTPAVDDIPPKARELFDRWMNARPPSTGRGPAKMVAPTFDRGAKVKPTHTVMEAGGPGMGSVRSRKATNAVKANDFLAAELGMKQGELVDIADVYQAVLGKTIMDDVRVKFPVPLVGITSRTAVPVTRAAAVQRKSYDTITAATGSTPKQLAKQLKDVNGEEKIILTDVQTDGFQALTREIGMYGLDRYLPERLMQPGADWSYLTPREYVEIQQLAVDIIAGPSTRRSKHIESLPTSFTESVIDGLFHNKRFLPGLSESEGFLRQRGRSIVDGFESHFTKEDPFRRIEKVPTDLMQATVRKLAAIPDELLNDVQQANRALGGPMWSPKRWAWSVKGHPEIVQHLFRDVTPPLVLDDVTHKAFAPLHEIETTGTATLQVEGQVKQKAAAYKPVLANPQARLEWAQAVEGVFLDPRRTMTEASDGERTALARLRLGVQDDMDVSVIMYGLQQRRQAIYDRADEIAAAFVGSSKGDVAALRLDLKLLVYEHFYKGDWDYVAEAIRLGDLRPVGRELAEARKAPDPKRPDLIPMQPLDSYKAVATLLARAKADKIMSDFFKELYQHNLAVTQESMFRSVYNRQAQMPDTAKRETRIKEHLASLGFKESEYNLVMKAHQNETQGFAKVVSTKDWRRFVYESDAAEKARKAAAKGGTLPPITRIENALKVASHDIVKKFKTRADADAAIARLRAEMQRRGLTDDAVLRGPSPDIEAMGKFGNDVMRAIKGIMTQWEGRSTLTWPNGKYQKIDIDATPDPNVYNAAKELLNKYGIHPVHKPEVMVPDVLVGPGGRETLMPTEVKEYVAKAVEEAAPANVDFSSSGVVDKFFKELGLQVKDPIMFGVFDNLSAYMLQGMTCGNFFPTFAFYAAQAQGNLMYIYMHEGLSGVGRNFGLALTHARFVLEATVAMTEGSPRIASLTSTVTKDGRIITSRMMAEKAVEHGLTAQWVSGEFVKAFNEDVMRYLETKPKWRHRLTLKGYRNAIAEAAGYIDNTFRMSVFVDNVRQGMSFGDAAEKARRIILDYSALSKVEREKYRRLFLFYTYTRRNMANVWYALVHNPSRVLGQIRLSRGINKVIFDDDDAIVTNDYTAGRLAIWYKRTGKVGYDGVRWLLSQLSVIDGITLFNQLFNLTDPNVFPEAIQRLDPRLQLAFGLALQKSSFSGTDLADPRNNKVPPVLVAHDNVVLGGALQRIFDIQQIETMDPWDAIDWEGGYRYGFVAKNWNVWQAFIKLAGIERTLDTLDMVDKLDIGAVEWIGKFGDPKMGSKLATTPPDVGRLGVLGAMVGARPSFTPSAEKVEQETINEINLREEMRRKAASKKLP